MYYALILSVVLVGCFAVPWEKATEEEYFEEKIDTRSFQVPIEVDESLPEGLVDSGVYNYTLLGFSWSNCGKPSDVLQIKNLQLSPDPIQVPGTVHAEADVVIAETVEVITSLAVVMKKKVFGAYIEVPCLNNIGSCTYENACDLLSKLQCPAELVKYGITCHCPLLKNEYKVPKADLKIPSLPLPALIENGDFQVQATLMNGSTRLGCYMFNFSLHKSSA